MKRPRRDGRLGWPTQEIRTKNLGSGARNGRHLLDCATRARRLHSHTARFLLNGASQIKQQGTHFEVHETETLRSICAQQRCAQQPVLRGIRLTRGAVWKWGMIFCIASLKRCWFSVSCFFVLKEKLRMHFWQICSSHCRFKGNR